MTVTRRSLLVGTSAPVVGALADTAAAAPRARPSSMRPGRPAPGRLALRPRRPGRHHRSDRRVRRRRETRLRRLRLAPGRRPPRLEHRARPDHPARHDQRHRLLPRRARLVPQHLHAATRPRREADLRRVRRRLHGLVRLLQRHRGRPPPLRLHRLRLRPHRPAPHRRHHRERHRGQGPEPAAQQPLVLRQRHLPRGPPGRHRPGARGPLGHLRHHTGHHRGARPRPGAYLRRERLRRRGGRRGRLPRRRRPRPDGRPYVLHGRRHRHGDRDPRTDRPRAEAVGLRGPPPLHPQDRAARRRRSHRHPPHPLRHPHLPLRPGRRIPPQRRPPQDQGCRPPPRPRRAGRRRQRRRDPCGR